MVNLKVLLDARTRDVHRNGNDWDPIGMGVTVNVMGMAVGIKAWE